MRWPHWALRPTLHLPSRGLYTGQQTLKTLDLTQDASPSPPSPSGLPFQPSPPVQTLPGSRLKCKAFPENRAQLTIPFSGHTPACPFTVLLNHHQRHPHTDPTWGLSQHFAHDSPAATPPRLPFAGAGVLVRPGLRCCSEGQLLPWALGAKPPTTDVTGDGRKPEVTQLSGNFEKARSPSGQGAWLLLEMGQDRGRF